MAFTQLSFFLSVFPIFLLILLSFSTINMITFARLSPLAGSLNVTIQNFFSNFHL